MRASDTETESTTRKREVIAVATRLFLANGYAGTSMNEVAAACSIQKATLYHHFPSKSALLVHCATDGYSTAMSALTAIRDNERLDDVTRFKRAMASLYAINLESTFGQMSPLIAEVSRLMPEVAQAFHDDFIGPQRQILNDIIDRGIARGTFGPCDRLGMEHLIFGPVVKLSLSRSMFAAFDRLDELFPVEKILESHCAMLLTLLTLNAPTK
jgi:AcrR family transcriptional regulator